MFPLLLIASLLVGDVGEGVPTTFAAQRKATRKAPKTAAAPAPPSTANYEAVMRKGYYGRGCPKRAQARSVADWNKPLQFLLIPGGDRGKVLIVGGEFTAGDADRLQSFLRTAGPISEVQLDSGGGNASEGPKVGRVIRAAHLSTRVASGFACISSCSMAFLGGMVRRIDDDAVYGVHTFFDGKILEGLVATPNSDAMRNYLHRKEQGNAMLAGQIQEYGQEMGISRQFFTEVMFAQRSEIFISDKRLGQLRVLFMRPLTTDQAFQIVEDLIKEGVLSYSTSQDKSDVREFEEWMTLQHTQDNVDETLASILSNDFRCLPADQLDKYNVTNVVRRR